MANFLTAYSNTSAHEGGWNIDNGGWTYRGISRKGRPDFEGWYLIDSWIRQNGMPKRFQYLNDPRIERLIPIFYKREYWDKFKGDLIQNQTIANFIFDFYVNSNKALKKINFAFSGSNNTQTLNIDTLSIINSNPTFAYDLLYKVRKKYYTDLLDNDLISARKKGKKPVLQKFKTGWFARLEKFPNKLPEVSGIDSCPYL